MRRVTVVDLAWRWNRAHQRRLSSPPASPLPAG